MRREQTLPMTDAQRAISDSIQTDSIIHLPYDENTAADLLAECEDSTDSDTETEYWGTDDDGQTWRVHMRRDDVPDNR
jgi:antitoxin component of MazEF toxin-antitoxin module